MTLLAQSFKSGGGTFRITVHRYARQDTVYIQRHCAHTKSFHFHSQFISHADVGTRSLQKQDHELLRDSIQYTLQSSMSQIIWLDSFTVIMLFRGINHSSPETMKRPGEVKLNNFQTSFFPVQDNSPALHENRGLEHDNRKSLRSFSTETIPPLHELLSPLTSHALAKVHTPSYSYEIGLLQII